VEEVVGNIEEVIILPKKKGKKKQETYSTERFDSEIRVQ